MANRAGSFGATLEQGSQALGWTIARVPFDPRAVWPKMIRLRVRGEINSFAFRNPDARQRRVDKLVSAAEERSTQA